MNINDQQQIAIRLGVRKKLIDDVFHNMIIALERLEMFLECQRRGGITAELQATGMKSSRDLHDDQKNPPTLESMLGELQVQCTALFFQTKLDDEELFAKTMKYFMTDLLEWYGGRNEEIPYDQVEMYVLPIIVSLSRQISGVLEIKQVCNDYVAKLRSMDEFSEAEKEKAVSEGFEAFIKSQHIVGERLQEFSESGKEVVFSVHQRGSASDGYKRIMDAMLKLYDTATPAKKVRATFTAYVEGLPLFTDEELDAAIAAKEHGLDALGQDDGSVNAESDGAPQVDSQEDASAIAEGVEPERDESQKDATASAEGVEQPQTQHE